MTRDRRYPERVPRRYAERPRSARDVRAAQRRRYSSPGPVQSTKALTTKLAMLSVAATILIGGLIAAQMAAGNDPALGPKAVARAKKAAAKSTTSSSTGTSSSSGSGTDPNTTSGSDGYYYGYPSDSSGYSSGSSGYSSGSSSSGYSTQQSAPAPVTSSTS
jgi:hypothetical protein